MFFVIFNLIIIVKRLNLEREKLFYSELAHIIKKPLDNGSNRDDFNFVSAGGFEPPTLCLKGRCSTPELRAPKFKSFKYM